MSDRLRIQFSRKHLAVVLALCAILTSVSASSTFAQDQGLGIRLTEVSADDANNPRAHLYVIDRVAPGTILTKYVEISNQTGADQDVTCYSSAASITGGKFTGADGSTGNELTSWIRMTKSILHINAGSVASVVVKFEVPADASEGERYGAIWAEIRGANEDSGILAINRVGIRVYLYVGSGGAPASSFVINSVTVKRNIDETLELDASVENTGGRALDISGTLNLSGGPGQTSAGPFETSLGTSLAIGGSGIVQVMLPNEIPLGPWDATLTLSSGLVTNSLTSRILFPEIGALKPVPFLDSSNWPIITVIAGAVVLISTVAPIQINKRLRRRRLLKAKALELL